MISILYTTSIYLYLFAARIFSVFDNKTKMWYEGQNHWKAVEFDRISNRKRVWFHCASVGEFEQARPIIESLKTEFSQIEVLLTFYSPSGFEMRRNYELADCVTYMPVDLPSQVNAFLDKMRPDIAVFVKYELWFNFIDQIHNREIPLALVCAHFPSHHFLFKWPGSMLSTRLKLFSEIQVQNFETKVHLEKIGLSNVVVAGDTRFERVEKIANEAYGNGNIEDFIKDHKVLVIGSNWPEDDEVILNALCEVGSLKIIVAPHEQNENQLNKWKEKFGSEMRIWSEMEESNMEDVKVLFVDVMGVLSKLYRFANFAYIGGGFGKSVHNTLEAAVYGIPVIFGPNNVRFAEVQQLKTIGSGFEIRDEEEFSNCIEQFMNSKEGLHAIKKQNEEYFDSNRGATKYAIDWIRKELEVKKPS